MTTLPTVHPAAAHASGPLHFLRADGWDVWMWVRGGVRVPAAGLLRLLADTRCEYGVNASSAQP